jgi:chitin deacetylase
VFALTFDDGPGPSTAALLDVLQIHSVRATFFLLGCNVAEAPWCGDPARARALAVRAALEGHVLGNHTYSHFRPDRWRELRADALRGQEVVRSVRAQAGVAEAPIPFRLPYGVRLVESTLPAPSGTLNGVTVDPRLPVIASLGLSHVHWTSDFDDWTMSKDDGPKLAQALAAHVLQAEALGLDAVLDLHDSGTGSSSGYDREATVEGVRLFLEEATRRGWHHFTVP